MGGYRRWNDQRHRALHGWDNVRWSEYRDRVGGRREWQCQRDCDGAAANGGDAGGGSAESGDGDDDKSECFGCRQWRRSESDLYVGDHGNTASGRDIQCERHECGEEYRGNVHQSRQLQYSSDDQESIKSDDDQ